MRKPWISGSAFSSLLLGLCLFASIQACKNPFARQISEKKESAASPEIILEDAGGSAIASDGSFNFGNVPVSVPTDQVFVLRNSGKSDLRIPAGSTSISGSDASCFSFPDAPPSSVAPGESARFSIRFLAVSVGAKSATVKLSTNDVSHKTFSFTLAGTGTNQVPAPVFEGGTMQCIPTGLTTVTLSCALAGASIYYTMDGSTPAIGNAATKLYAGAFSYSFSSTGAICAMAVADQYLDSVITTAHFTQAYPTAPTFKPTITPDSGGIYLSSAVSSSNPPGFTISSDTSNAKIVFTIDGSTTPDPATTGSVVADGGGTISDATKTYIAVNGATIYYAGPHAGGSLTIQAKAFLLDKGIYYSSSNQSATYYFKLAAPAWASVQPQADYFTSAQSVTLSGPSGAAIYYTTDGTTTPSSSSTAYSGAITVPLGAEGSSTAMTIKAIAIEAEWQASEVLSDSFYVCGPGKWDSSKWDQATWQ